MTQDGTSAHNDMAAFRKGYIEQLKSLFPGLIQLKNSLTRATNPNVENIVPLAKMVHSLSGLGTMVGFPAISKTGLKLGKLLDITNPDMMVKALRDNQVQVISRLDEFEKACHDAIMSEFNVKGSDSTAIVHSHGKVVCVLARAGDTLHELDKQLCHFGYAVSTSATLGEFKSAVINLKPHIVIAYSDLNDADVEMLQSLPQDIIERNFTTQLIVIAPKGGFDARLAAVRVGANGFFTESADVIQIIDKIEQLVVKFAVPATYHVLVVDDDEIQVRFYTHVLQAAGINTTIISRPEEALAVIADNAVDLILMDFIMPNCNGQELATIIRQHEKYVSLPIIFLSARDDIEALLINTGLGIDDFLVKPVTGEQLVSVVRSRAQRSAELQVLMARDSFTGLLNHVHFTDMLEMELGQVKRFKTNTAYAIIDLDHFKDINDTYGHSMGDHVIKSLSRMLQQRLRRSDIIGRCGGEEFGILMPDCTLENASLILESMRLQFADLAFKFEQTEVKVTFSAGLTSLSGHDNMDDIIKTADKALYDAKNQGRNRLVIA